jgi:hypothetical protein
MKKPKKSPVDEKKEQPEKDPVDEELKSLERRVLSELKSARIQPDYRGEFFSNNHLNDLREVLEEKGFAIAKHFQKANIQAKDKKWEQIKNQILLNFLEGLEKLHFTDKRIFNLITVAFIVGKLNPILLHLEANE